MCQLPSWLKSCSTTPPTSLPKIVCLLFKCSHDLKVIWAVCLRLLRSDRACLCAWKGGGLLSKLPTHRGIHQYPTHRVIHQEPRTGEKRLNEVEEPRKQQHDFKNNSTFEKRSSSSYRRRQNQKRDGSSNLQLQEEETTNDCARDKELRPVAILVPIVRHAEHTAAYLFLVTMNM